VIKMNVSPNENHDIWGVILWNTDSVLCLV
jgi:hypothetical protein